MTRVFLTVCAIVLALSACTPGESGPAGPTTGSGYQGGDGSYTVWAQGERGEPIRVQGSDLAGEAIDSSAWRGSVAVINFWYSACPPCRAEATDLQALHEEFPEVYFLGVNPRDEVSAANAFVDTFAITYPNVLDTNATIVADLQGKVPLQAMPTTIVIDPQGRIYGRILGRITPSVLRGMIEDARAEAGDG